MKNQLSFLQSQFPNQGEVLWIGLRPAKKAEILSVQEVEASTDFGLVGDHFSGTYSKKRQVTFIQAEHLDTIASLLGKENIDPKLLRRNILVKGINLIALKQHQFQIGEAIFEMTGACHPCSRMEENLGKGGYNAVRGHGGITAQVIKSGKIKVGDELLVISNDKFK